MKSCEICFVTGDRIRVFEGIYEGKLINICERCSIIENVPIVKKPEVSQLKESETLRIQDRMKRMTGISEQKSRKQDTFFVEDKLKKLEANPRLESPEENLNLMDHFHWEIMKQRRRKGLSQEKLAKILGESEIAIQMLEKGRLPGNSEALIRKLEQFFQVSLRKVSERDRILKQLAKNVRSEPVLLDDKGQVLTVIPEEEMVFIENTEDGKKDNLINEDEDLDLKKIDIRKVTIADLKNLHRKKVWATKNEQIEEKRRIEERRRQIEALKEKEKAKFGG